MIVLYYIIIAVYTVGITEHHHFEIFLISRILKHFNIIPPIDCLKKKNSTEEIN